MTTISTKKRSQAIANAVTERGLWRAAIRSAARESTTNSGIVFAHRAEEQVMAEQRVCEACGGCGYIVVPNGLSILQDKYPTLPIREMEKRGWLGDVGDGEDVARCDAAFLRFWGAKSHSEVRSILSGNQR